MLCCGGCGLGAGASIHTMNTILVLLRPLLGPRVRYVVLDAVNNTGVDDGSVSARDRK